MLDSHISFVAEPAGAMVAHRHNLQGNTTFAGSGNIFSETVALAAGKTLSSVTLPGGGALTAGTPGLHVFGLAAGVFRGDVAVVHRGEQADRAVGVVDELECLPQPDRGPVGDQRGSARVPRDTPPIR